MLDREIVTVSLEEMAKQAQERDFAASKADPDLLEDLDAIGVSYHSAEILRCGDKERERDRHRWELDPASSEDYRGRMRTFSTRTPGGAPLTRNRSIESV